MFNLVSSSLARAPGEPAIAPLSLVDTAFVGSLGAEALGALGINASLFFAMAFLLFNFLADVRLSTT